MTIEISRLVSGIGDALATSPARGKARRARNLSEVCMRIIFWQDLVEMKNVGVLNFVLGSFPGNGKSLYTKGLVVLNQSEESRYS